MLNFLDAYVDEHGNGQRYEISIVSEISRGRSFSFSGTFAAVLSTAIHVDI